MSPSSDSDSNHANFLNDDLLGQNDPPSPAYKAAKTAQSVPSPRRQPSPPPAVAVNGHNIRTNGLNRSTRLVIGIDFGTTFTGVAFATPQDKVAKLEDIRTISDWGLNMTNNYKIPSIYSYSPSTTGQPQWGLNINRDAVTMVNTKLELDVQDNKIDELELLLQVLDGTRNLNFDHVKSSKGDPEYTWKDPEMIIKDFLKQVFKVVHKKFEDVGSHVLGQIPIDIVITVPVGWSYRAKNSTLQAIRKAGFNEKSYPKMNDIIMITEPEAAAIFTARHLKEDKKEEFLKIGQCFVLCDAGGGTVDTVAYMVKQLEPTLELERISIPTSRKCGSSYIDANFKLWFRNAIKDDKYKVFDPTISTGRLTNTMEGGLLRDLVKRFDGYKKSFSNSSPDVKFALPQHNDKAKPMHVPGKVDQGLLTITHKEMRDLFDPCVDGVLELILGQILQVESQGSRVKNVFLVGGFGESPFLQEEINTSLARRGITMRRPEKPKAWTAVVEGAVMYGIEKDNYENVVTMATCSRSYGIVMNEAISVYKYDKRDVTRDAVTNGIVAQSQLVWLIRRGDLLLSDIHKESEKPIVYHFKGGDSRKFKIPIYEYLDDDEKEPTRFETAKKEVETVATLDIDLSSVPLGNFDQHRNSQTGSSYYSASLLLKMKLFSHKLDVQIWMDEELFCETTIDNLETETSRERVANS